MKRLDAPQPSSERIRCGPGGASKCRRVPRVSDLGDSSAARRKTLSDSPLGKSKNTTEAVQYWLHSSWSGTRGRYLGPVRPILTPSLDRSLSAIGPRYIVQDRELLSQAAKLTGHTRATLRRAPEACISLTPP